MSERATHTIAYGYRRKPADLKALGADVTYVDWDGLREERAQMIRDLRNGDKVLVLFERDIGGSSSADALWRQRIEEHGAELVVVSPKKKSRPAHRPRQFDPGGVVRERIRNAWLDEAESQKSRLKSVEKIWGRPVAASLLYYHFGKPGAPRADTSKET